jgi:hypothetical protein
MMLQLGLKKLRVKEAQFYAMIGLYSKSCLNLYELTDTYLYNWTVMNRRYFPFAGDRVTIWFSDVDYVDELEGIHELSMTLSNQTDIIDGVESWTGPFLDYVEVSSPNTNVNQTGFPVFNETTFGRLGNDRRGT